jgi:two-component system OmpR family sensor kinase
MIRLTLKTRLAVWHAVWVVVILAGAAWVSDWALARLVRGQIDHALITLARNELAAIEQAPHEPLRIHEVPGAPSRAWFERLDKFVQIVGLEGEPVARSRTLGTARLPLRTVTGERVKHGDVVYETVEDFGEEPIRMVSVPLTIGAAHYVIQVAGSLDDARTVIRAARWLFLIVALAILTAVVATGALLTRRALVPIARIVKQARRIGQSSLAERLPHPGTHDEIAGLVETLNDMLGRIEHSFELQRRFTADASHELMSPLSRLRAEFEVTLRRPREAAEYEEALRSGVEEVERLCLLVEELLRLAQVDSGEDGDPSPGPTDLPAILERLMRQLEDEAGRRHVTMGLDTVPAVSVKASPGVVTVVVANVLENAVKFSGAGGHVDVTVDTDGDHAVVAVSDSGPGVQADEVPFIFERFHRGTASRATETRGAGLGLAICRTLVERHGGHVSVTSDPGHGATFAIRLPLARELPVAHTPR